MTDLDDAHVRLAAAVARLFEHMDDEADEDWDHLTGMQILLLRDIAKRERTDRSTLAASARSSRAATTPGLASLLKKGFIIEVSDLDGPHLMLSDSGRLMLEGVRRARASWLRHMADSVDPPVPVDEVVRLSGALEHFLGDR